MTALVQRNFFLFCCHLTQESVDRLIPGEILENYDEKFQLYPMQEIKIVIYYFLWDG